MLGIGYHPFLHEPQKFHKGELLKNMPSSNLSQSQRKESPTQLLMLKVKLCIAVRNIYPKQWEPL